MLKPFEILHFMEELKMKSAPTLSSSKVVQKARVRNSQKSKTPPSKHILNIMAGKNLKNSTSTRSLAPSPAKITEWDLLSLSSKDEIDQLLGTLKAIKSGDFSVRLPYEKDGI